MRRFSPKMIALGAMNAAAVCLGVTILYQLKSTSGLNAVPDSVFNHEIPLETELVAIPEIPRLNHYAVISRRPAFSKSRRPPVRLAAVMSPPQTEQPLVVKPDDPVVLASPSLVLVGVAVASEGSVALIKESNSDKVTRVLVGALYNGWTVDAIGLRGVTFSSNQRKFDLPILFRQSEDP